MYKLYNNTNKDTFFDILLYLNYNLERDFYILLAIIMTKRTNNHVNEQFGNLENLDKINNTDTNLPKNYKTISDLLANFSNHE